MTRIAIHQPNYFPWIGFFYKMAHVDVFVFLDDVAYQSGNASSVTNRTRIKTSQGPLLLSVPVHEGGSGLVMDAGIDYKQKWIHKHLSSLRFAYARSSFLSEAMPLVETVLGTRPAALASLNQDAIRSVCDYLGIRTSLAVSSTLGIKTDDKNVRILEICRRFQARTYLSGSGARRYNDENLFASHGIELEYTDFSCPEYSQLHGSFLPNLSILDAIFNCGRDASRLLA